MISYEVRNTRGLVVRTFGAADQALGWAKTHSEALTDTKDGLQAYAVEIIRRERLLTAVPEITTARQRRRAAS
jgi:hypothetical protein